MTSEPSSLASYAGTVERWLTEVGFRFNPFAHLDASTDPHLTAYLVEHQAFTALWGEWPTLVFAPAGGGKTALRVLVARACWSGPDLGHPFPVSYVPQMNNRGELPETLAEHCRAILQAGAVQLLRALLARPHWWGRLETSARKLLRGLLDQDLPAPLAHYLDWASESAAHLSLMRDTDWPGLQAEAPAGERQRSLCAALLATPPAATPADPLERLKAFVEVLVGALSLSSVYLLVDGVDSFSETAADPRRALALIAPLLSQTATWQRQHLLFKGFFPAEIASALETDYRELLGPGRRADIKWSTPLLADVIRRRIFVATEGAFGSLDAVSTPDLTDVETQLARAVAPLPREALLLTGRLLWERARRNDPKGRLDATDLEAALAWYRGQQLFQKASGPQLTTSTSLRQGRRKR